MDWIRIGQELGRNWAGFSVASKAGIVGLVRLELGVG